MADKVLSSARAEQCWPNRLITSLIERYEQASQARDDNSESRISQTTYRASTATRRPSSRPLLLSRSADLCIVSVFGKVAGLTIGIKVSTKSYRTKLPKAALRRK